MDVSVQAILAGYEAEIGRLTRRAIVAEQTVAAMQEAEAARAAQAAEADEKAGDDA